MFCICFFFNDTATTEIYTLSLHDALPIYPAAVARRPGPGVLGQDRPEEQQPGHREVGQHELVPERVAHQRDRKSTRLNSSHANISYAVFCLKKKTTNNAQT